MKLDLQYIVAAIKAMNTAAEAIRCGTPEQRGRAAAHCISAAIDLEVRIAYAPVQIEGAQIAQASGALQ
jgi:hypothetical protein